MQEQQTEYTITEKFSLNYWPLSISTEWNAWHKAKAELRRNRAMRTFTSAWHGKMVWARARPQTAGILCMQTE